MEIQGCTSTLNKIWLWECGLACQLLYHSYPTRASRPWTYVSLYLTLRLLSHVPWVCRAPGISAQISRKELSLSMSKHKLISLASQSIVSPLLLAWLIVPSLFHSGTMEKPGSSLITPAFHQQQPCTELCQASAGALKGSHVCLHFYFTFYFIQ